MEARREVRSSLAAGAAIRLDLNNNLEQLNEFRPRSILPVRSDIDLFAERRLSLDRLYLSYLKTLQTDLHVGLTGGYLEEQYAGLGSEVLYRPFGKNWAVGAEAWQVFKRDPNSSLNMNLTVDSLLSGHVNAWWRPSSAPNTVFQARAGRYLGEDLGASLSLTHLFQNGAELSGFVTVSDKSEFDVFGKDTHLYHGLRLSVPIGSFPLISRNSRIDVIAEPFGRDTGQALDKPVDLYRLTEPFSLQHMTQHWGDILE